MPHDDMLPEHQPGSGDRSDRGGRRAPRVSRRVNHGEVVAGSGCRFRGVFATLGVLISARFKPQAILDAIREGKLDARVAVVLSNIEGAPGSNVRERRRSHRVLLAQGFPSRAVRRSTRRPSAPTRSIWSASPGFVAAALARIVRASTTIRRPPSLPPGICRYRNAQRQALERGVKVTGATRPPRRRGARPRARPPAARRFPFSKATTRVYFRAHPRQGAGLPAAIPLVLHGQALPRT